MLCVCFFEGVCVYVCRKLKNIQDAKKSSRMKNKDKEGYTTTTTKLLCKYGDD